MRAVVLAVVLGALGPGPAHAAAPAEWTRVPEHRGVSLIIHGAGWQHTDGLHELRQPYVRAAARRHNVRARFSTLNTTYAPRGEGWHDILEAYRTARRRARGKPVCAWGTSAGAYWAATLAWRTRLDCLVAEGLPADLNALPPVTRTAAAFAFPDLTAASPASHPIRARTLIATARDDTTTPPFASKLPGRPDPLVLEPGSCTFTHAMVDCAQLRAFRAAERRFLLETARGAAAAPGALREGS